MIYSKEHSEAEEFYHFNDQLNFNACLNLLANVGENVGKLSEEIKNEEQSIPWKVMKDFRNRIVHDYVGLNMFIIFDVIKKELPVVLKKLYETVNQSLKNQVYDKEEYEAAKDSFYYRHIDFTEIDKG